MKFEHSVNEDANHNSEIFTISGQVPPPRTRQLNVDRTLSRNKDLSQPTPQVLVGEIDSVGRSRSEDDAETPQIVFGRERLHVLDLLRQRTAELCVFLKQKFHTRTLNIENPSSQGSATNVEPHLLQTSTNKPTHTSVANLSSLTVDQDFSSSNLKIPRRPKRRLDSAKSEEYNPVQNLVPRYTSVIRVPEMK